MQSTNLKSAIGIALFFALSILVTVSCKKEKSVFAVADFSFAGNISNLPATVQFTNKSIGLSYTWDFGDGSTSTAENPSHTYTQFGLYKVKLTAQGTNNVDSMVLDIVVGGTLGQITVLNCNAAQINRTIKTGDVLNQHPVLVPYTGGNGGVYNGQSIASTGVTGLTATLTAGTLASGAGNLEYKLTGTPQDFGQATFILSVRGIGCELNIEVLDSAAPIYPYPVNTIHCNPNNPTAVIEVLNPITGRIWMDRNLGGIRIANSSTDALAYGDLYQWGRRADGHQCRNSGTTNIPSSVDQPQHGDFFISSWDWRNPSNNNLWQGVNGINNPCPTGFRIPTEIEFNAERLSWSSNNALGALNSPLKLPLPGFRNPFDDAPLRDVGILASYWSSTVPSIAAHSHVLSFGSNFAGVGYDGRSRGYSVRCIKN